MDDFVDARKSLDLYTTERHSLLPFHDLYDEDVAEVHKSRSWYPWFRNIFRSRSFTLYKQRHGSGPCNRCGHSPKKRRVMNIVTIFGLLPLALLGLFQLSTIINGVFKHMYPKYRPFLVDWSQIGKEGYDLRPWPVDFTRDVRPVACHSHNDYERPLPLYSALSAGCTSVEADVWFIDGELYVGHYERSLTKNRTLASLYVDPLIEILDRQNSESDPMFSEGGMSISGVFSAYRDESLTLLIDFKNSPDETWSTVSKALEPLRSKGYLSSFNGTGVSRGPITVVVTGDAKLDFVNSELHNPHHDIFFDAPLDQMADDRADQFSVENSYLASVSFGKTIGTLWSFKFSAKQRKLLKEQVQGAHDRGLKVRYWSLPEWPVFLRNYVWEVLLEEGVDFINVDDLHGATAVDWRK